MKTRLLIATVALLSAASPAVAQSLFNSAGLGLPLEALDGRSRALGNLGIGLPGASFLPTDPAALGRFTVSTGVIAAQPSWVDFSNDVGQSGNFQGNRFPLIGLAYPIAGGMASVQLGSFLDQNFRIASSGSVMISGEAVTTDDEFLQDGSVSNLNVGYARLFGEDLSLGLTLGRYAGSVDRILVRRYGGGEVGIDDYVEAGIWRYVGHSVTAGGSWDLSPDLRLAGSVQLPTDLEANASAVTRGSDRSFDLPIRYRLGASANLGESLLVTGSFAMADWSKVQDDLTSGAFANSTTGVGVGVELSRARLWGKDAPLRFGFRRVDLPFSTTASGATEQVFSGGFGLALNTTNDVVLAGIDLAIERGRRSGGGLTENFWRATLSLLASGF